MKRIMRSTPLERVCSHLVVSGDCLLARYTDNGRGYVSVYQGRGLPHLLAHRVVWEEMFGPIPSGLVVMHACDTPNCVQPMHLRLGTYKENSQDAWNKGRMGWQLHPATRLLGNLARRKLTEQNVRDIRSRYAAGGVTQKALGMEYGVTQAAIHLVTSGQKWAWLK